MKRLARGIPLTWRQLVVADLVVLAAFALAFNRPYFPTWLLPEYSTNPWVTQLAQPRQSSPDALWQHILHEAMPSELRAWINAIPDPTGHPLLVIGDSMVLGWPWTADVVCVPAGGYGELAEAFEQRTRPYHYEQIVLWVGTAPFILGKSGVRSYTKELQRMLALVQERGDAVFVIGPMPISHGEGQWWYAGAAVSDTRELVSTAMARLAKRLPQVTALNVAPWRQTVVENGALDQMTVDRFHLTREGFLSLESHIRGLGVELERADAAGAGLTHAAR